MDENGIVIKPPYDADAGSCCFCNHALPYAYSLTAIEGSKVVRGEFPLGSKEADAMEDLDMPIHSLGAGIGLIWPKGKEREQVKRLVQQAGTNKFRGLHEPVSRPSIVLATNRICEAVSEDIFRQASRVARERGTKRRLAIQTNVSAKEIASKRAVANAARKLAGGMLEQSSAPPAVQGDEPHF